jgi:hypothetical protein
MQKMHKQQAVQSVGQGNDDCLQRLQKEEEHRNKEKIIERKKGCAHKKPWFSFGE